MDSAQTSTETGTHPPTHPHPSIPLVSLQVSPGGMGSRCHTFRKACGSTPLDTHTAEVGEETSLGYIYLTPPQREFLALLTQQIKRTSYLLSILSTERLNFLYCKMD